MTSTHINDSDIDALVGVTKRHDHFQTIIFKHEIANDYYEFCKTSSNVPPGSDWQRNTRVGKNGFFKQWHWYRRK